MTSASTLDDSTRAAATGSGRGLAPRTRLRDYEITGLIGEGACSIVYLAWDHLLQRKVALKEYMPASIAARVSGASALVVKSERHFDTFKAGLKSFVNEARLLARFDHPSLVKVYRFWEANGTSYMVMPFHEGPTLKTALAELGHVPEESELRRWLGPLVDALAVLHEQGLLHQHVGPDEILVAPTGPVLLGMAMPEQTLATLAGKPDAFLTPGYAAPEQYGSSNAGVLGPWTDFYALAAIVHAAITGSEPPAAPKRLATDRLPSLRIVAADLYSAQFLAGVDAALVLDPARRPRDHGRFRASIGGLEPAVAAVALLPPVDPMHEPFLERASNDREVTVPDRPLLSPAAASPAEQPADPRPRLVAATPLPPAPTMAAPRRAPPRPSWMSRADGAPRRPGKRVLYGAIAGSCALIGIVALMLQTQSRPASPRAAATSVPASSAPLDRATLPAPTAAPTYTPVVTPGPASTALASIAPASSAEAAALGALSAARVASTVAPMPEPAMAASSLPGPGTTAAAQERQTRCLGILQKASLEPITAAETEFFKQACK